MRGSALLRSVFVALAVVVSVLLGAPRQLAGSVAAQEGGLLGPDTGHNGQPLPDGAAVLRRRIAAVDRAVVAQMTGSAATSGIGRLALFPDATIDVIWERRESTGNRSGTVWIGHVAGQQASQVTLVLDGGLVSGSVRMTDHLFRIQSLDAASAVVDEIELRAATPELPPLRPGPDRPVGPRIATIADDGSTIDVLVVYTPAARQEAGGTAAIEGQVDLVAAETNAAYANSGIVQRIRIVQKAEIAYAESGSGITDLTRLRDTSDGYLDSVHALRDSVGADIVALIVANMDGCGIAYLGYPAASWLQSYAFSVVERECAVSNLSFAHELGHVMGADHDWATESSGDQYAYNHGYIDTSLAWRTIMAYPQPCGSCPRLPYFSNPDLSRDGRPMGVAQGTYHGADNRTILNGSRTTVANFRQTRVVTSFLTVTTTAGGMVTSAPAGISCGVTCTASFPGGTSVSLTATPLAGQRFAGWGGACSGTGGCTVTMSADRAVSAAFEPVAPTLGVTVADSPDPLEAGSDLTYSVAVKNTGSVPLSGAGTVTLALSAPVQYVRGSAATALSGPCLGDGGTPLQAGVRTSTVTCTWASLSLDPGAVQPVTIVVSPTSAGTLTATVGVQVGTVRAAPAATTSTVTLPPAACSPRPPIAVRSQPTGDGRLAVTVAATGENNRLLRVHFFTDTRVDRSNGLVEIPGRADPVRDDYTYSLSGDQTSLMFYVRRALPGQAVTVPFEVADRCGAWPTFVGGGPNGF